MASPICVLICSWYLLILVAFPRAFTIHLHCSVTGIHSYLLFVPLRFASRSFGVIELLFRAVQVTLASHLVGTRVWV